jgi:hypothetical protein
VVNVVRNANQINGIGHNKSDGNFIVGTGTCFAGFIVALILIIPGAAYLLKLASFSIS